MKVLSINTYGGSLLVGAKALGMEIIGSYEDTGFGIPIQQHNFPGLDFRPMRKDWPDQDLSETVVIAHPPCSAFSVQNNNPKKKGVDSDAFACTISVLDYSMRNGALALAVESVVGALAGAWNVHQHFADEYGYNLYRVLQNGSMFGAQWRDRFWAVFVKKGAAPDMMPWVLQPRFQTVREVVDGHEDGPSPAGMDEALDKLKRRFAKAEHLGEDEGDVRGLGAGLTPEQMQYVFFNEHGHEKNHGTSVDDVLWKLKFKDQDRWDVCKKYVTKYASGAMIFLNPDGAAPVLLGGSWWYLHGRNLSEKAYKRIMGFPADYGYPEQGRYRAEMRTYLSKGVMPPVAAWILDQVTQHLGWSDGNILPSDPDPTIDVKPYVIEVEQNNIADFRYSRSHFGESRPRLRHEEEQTVGSIAPDRTLRIEVPRIPETRELKVRQHRERTWPTLPAEEVTCGMRITQFPNGDHAFKVVKIETESPVDAPPLYTFHGDGTEEFTVPEGYDLFVVGRGRVKVDRIYTPRRRSRTLWNAPEIEEALKATLFTRPHTADQYALYESHGYHRMGVKEGDVVLDIGGHIGCVASRAALVGAKQVITIEAEPENFALLQQNTQTFPNVQALHGAVYGGNSETVTLHRTKKRNDEGHSTGTHSVVFKTRGDSIEVKRYDFRELLKTYQPDVVKVDIEGSEFSLDFSDMPASVRAIGIELHTRRDENRPKAQAIVDTLLAQGFTPVNRLNMQSNFSAIIAYFSRPVETDVATSIPA